nr:hypothetical protein [Tanacetum cinerariifolium]
YDLGVFHLRILTRRLLSSCSSRHYILQRFLSPRIRPLSPRALEAEMNAIASSLYHSLHPSGTPPLLPISTPSTSRRAGIPEADTPPRNRPLLATARPRCEVEESFAAAARRPGPTMAHGVDCSYVETRLRDTERRMMVALELVNLRVSYQVDVCTRESSEFCTRDHDAQKDRVAVRAKIEVLRSERLAYEQEVLETHTHRLKWKHQAADDLHVQHIMRTQALEAGARDDTLEDTSSKLAIICTKFVSNETEKVDKYISGLSDNIYRNVKSSKPKTLDETIELANDLMDQKLRTYAKRKSDGKRKADDTSRNNQQPFKKQNVAKAYNLGSAEKKTYEGNVPKKGLCLNLQKSTKNRTISTQDQKPQRKSGSRSSFSSNNLTLKLNLSKIQSSGTSPKIKAKSIKSQRQKSRD